MTDNLLSHIEQNIARRRLLSRGDRVIVAVSGGVDSMVLLHLLQRLSKSHKWTLIVAHLNHALRGRSSDADERLVLKIAESQGLKLVTGRADVRALARKEKISIEMAARRIRHAFLARTARRLGGTAIAVAHHADDQVELFFLRCLRGSGGDGLGGMKWKGPSPADSRVRLIRPLLDVSRETLEEYATENRVAFRTDASNASLDFQRNRIRHELLPLLRRRFQPQLNRVIPRVMELIAADADFVDEAARAWLKQGQGRGFDWLHVAVQRRCIQCQLQDLGLAVDFDRVEALRTQEGRPVTVAPKVRVVRRASGFLELCPANLGESITTEPQTVVFGRKGSVIYGDREISWRITRTSGHLPAAQLGREVFDADRVGDEVVLRRWRAGDRFQPIGMPCAVKLQDLFVNLKIPRAERSRLVVATTAAGELFWVERVRVAEQFKVTERTIRRLLWHWKPT